MHNIKPSSLEVTIYNSPEAAITIEIAPSETRSGLGTSPNVESVSGATPGAQGQAVSSHQRCVPQA